MRIIVIVVNNQRKLYHKWLFISIFPQTIKLNTLFRIGLEWILWTIKTHIAHLLVLLFFLQIPGLLLLAALLSGIKTEPFHCSLLLWVQWVWQQQAETLKVLWNKKNSPKLRCGRSISADFQNKMIIYFFYARTMVWIFRNCIKSPKWTTL